MTLLARTAENLFWLARYTERAENTARIMEAAHRLAVLPALHGGSNEWQSALDTVGLGAAFAATGKPVTPDAVCAFLSFGADNPSSIHRCFTIARSNARAQRTALTIEMWEAINAAYHEIEGWAPRGCRPTDVPRFVAFVKEASLRIEGSASRTMLRNDAFWFTQLGLLIERADNTARILDVKYHVLLPDDAKVGGSLDYYQWSAILRSVSALTSYHWVYRDSLKPWLVAELLLLREEMPRSLRACYREITRCLDEIAQAYGRQGPSQRLARGMHSRLSNARIEEIFQSGLHGFVEGLIAENARLGQSIAEQYLG